MKIRFLLLFLSFFCGIVSLQAQGQEVRPHSIVTGNFIGESRPLRDLPTLSREEYDRLVLKAEKKQFNERLKIRYYPFAENALPAGSDPVVQKSMGTFGMSRSPVVNFEGLESPYYPPDCNGAAGPGHYMQTINCVYGIYSKSGVLLAGPTNMNLLFGNVPGANCNDGDPVVLYDEQAGRWFAAEFSFSGSTDYILIAVSTTSDPTGTWYQYSFPMATMPDYPKFGIWRDGYYMGVNSTTGKDIYVFQRSQMIIGGTALMVGFDNPYRPTSVDGFVVVPPVDNDGVFAPAGSPGTFIAFNDDAVGGGTDELWIYELSVNWGTPLASTFSRIQQIPVAPFSSNFGTTWNNIAQPVPQKLDAIPQVIMNPPQYRNFGSYQTLVCCHTVNADNNTSTNHAGIRWYELRRGTQTSGGWSIRQQGTYAPDEHSRWMGSIMLNGSGKIGVGYSISSSALYPGIRYSGQSSVAYNEATGMLDVPEEIILTGSNAQTTFNRYGDYASLSIDPVDDQTFWFSTEYIGAGGGRHTRIASFKIGNIPISRTLDATPVTINSSQLNGMVNPNNLPTDCHFEWGATTSYGNSTPNVAYGSGTTELPVSAGIAGLTQGTEYHYRIVATNSDGISHGEDFSFTPGNVNIKTTDVSSITMTTASAGGHVITDGGFQVTSRGICWGTSMNPTISGSHTTEGSGIGVFTSLISGLSSNTSYHLRAYATSANGTFYGEDITITTLCDLFTSPFTEVFVSTSIPTCWSQVDHQGNGQVWMFGTIPGAYPSPVLTGNYAYINSDGYGSGYIQDADLITPAINLSSYLSITLEFQHYFKAYTGSSGTLSYSIDNGVTWTALVTFTTTSSNNPALFSQSIPGAAGQSLVKFKWNYTGSYAFFWAIDNISVTGTSVSSPIVTTSPLSGITHSSAITGGHVTSSGISYVTERGVCWGSSVNPTIANNHTHDGSGTGIYLSSLTGLNPGMTYHVRAYATNSYSTSYGEDLVFSTLCAPISSFPWNEGFENGGSMPNCWSQEQVSGSGIVWSFITGSGNSHPAAAHSGTYNACLKDNTTSDNKTRLISPAIYLSTLVNPQLKFWHTQASWGGDQDHLSVYYRVSLSDPWVLLTTYTTSITSWKLETITLPNPSASYYIAFEGNARFGYGICLDDVSVTGTVPTLTVTPGNQVVSYLAGATSFSVSSNSTWTVSTSEPWVSVTPAGTGNGTIVASFTQNPGSSSRVAVISVMTPGIATVLVTLNQSGTPDKTLSLQLFLEGLYNGDGNMRPAMNEDGYQWGISYADEIVVELHDAVSYPTIIYSVEGVMVTTQGSATTLIPGIYSGEYYLSIRHRNSIETVSSCPVSFAPSTISYSFENPKMVYGSNLMLMIDGRWVIFTGDVDQDGIIDSHDLSISGNFSNEAIGGYIPEDTNGDGLVDASDLSIINNNASDAVMSKLP